MEELKKPRKAERHQNLRKFWKLIQAQNEKAVRYNYTKLVPSEKAYRYIHGEMTLTGTRMKKLKNEYRAITTIVNGDVE